MEVLFEVNSILAHYSEVRKHTLTLCKDLETEDFVAQPADFVSPPKWHLAHTTWFFETFVLTPFLDSYKVYHPKYAYIFNSYYQAAGARAERNQRGSLTRPSVEQILAYRTYVDHAMGELLSSAKGLISEVIERIILGLQHEQQHQELLAYDIKFILGNNPLYPTADLGLKQLEWVSGNSAVELKKGLYTIGHTSEDFHFDNEKPAHQVYLEQASVSSSLVTNAQVLAFIEAGGYSDFTYWLDEGWTWVQTQKIDAPEYWQNVEGSWHYYQLDQGLVPVIPEKPAMHISFYEADAIARFYEAELPTEFEREILWNELQNGQLWEWSASAYRPYPGFKAVPGALGEYNGKFMINQMVLKGGSIATAEKHIRHSYRNFFHPSLRWMFSGFRLLFRA